MNISKKRNQQQWHGRKAFNQLWEARSKQECWFVNECLVEEFLSVVFSEKRPFFKEAFSLVPLSPLVPPPRLSLALTLISSLIYIVLVSDLQHRRRLNITFELSGHPFKM